MLTRRHKVQHQSVKDELLSKTLGVDQRKMKVLPLGKSGEWFFMIK
jgi:hypothetical protein